jgi:hypothetical protein
MKKLTYPFGEVWPKSGAVILCARTRKGTVRTLIVNDTYLTNPSSLAQSINVDLQLLAAQSSVPSDEYCIHPALFLNSRWQ